MKREEKIIEAIKAKYKSIREFSKISGIPNSTIMSMLKKGLGGTSVDTVLLICKHLDMQIEDLQDDKLNQNKFSLSANKKAPDISEDEQELLNIYKKLSPDGAKRLLAFAKFSLGEEIKAPRGYNTELTPEDIELAREIALDAIHSKLDSQDNRA